MLAALLLFSSCADDKGALLYRETRASLRGRGSTLVIEAYDSGYWSLTQRSRAASQPTPRSGCVDPAPLRRAVNAAPFKTHGCCCDAVADEAVTYEAPARKLRLATEEPCGPMPDPVTAKLIALVRSFAH